MYSIILTQSTFMCCIWHSPFSTLSSDCFYHSFVHSTDLLCIAVSWQSFRGSGRKQGYCTREQWINLVNSQFWLSARCWGSDLPSPIIPVSMLCCGDLVDHSGCVCTQSNNAFCVNLYYAVAIVMHFFSAASVRFEMNWCLWGYSCFSDKFLQCS